MLHGHVQQIVYRRATRPLYSYIYAYDSPYNVVIVIMWRCPYGELFSRLQAQGWSVVEREQAFAE